VELHDNWLPNPYATEFEFWDMIHFNTDTMSVTDEYNRIAGLYFRIYENRLMHDREVYQLIDFMGDVGGIKDILMQAAFFIFGGYLTFH
jgi:hypothetical protein